MEARVERGSTVPPERYSSRTCRVSHGVESHIEHSGEVSHAFLEVPRTTVDDSTPQADVRGLRRVTVQRISLASLALSNDAMGHHRHHQRHRRYSVSAPVDDRAMHDHPRPAYLTSLEIPSQTVSIVAPKTHLLITDLDETLLHVLSHCPEGGVKGRPYLHSFISYMLHPQSPFALGVWTFAGRCKKRLSIRLICSDEWCAGYGIAHLRSLGLGRLFADGDLSAPHLSPSVLSFFGFEDSGLTEKQMDDGHRPHVKDLNLVRRLFRAARLC
jgi:hypothetical protein